MAGGHTKMAGEWKQPGLTPWQVNDECQGAQSQEYMASTKRLATEVGDTSAAINLRVVPKRSMVDSVSYHSSMVVKVLLTACGHNGCAGRDDIDQILKIVVLESSAQEANRLHEE
ncbi:unnamed protein product, partial [Pylaiella littoralis]